VGGNEMNFIPVNEPLLNGNEKKYLNECIDTGWISSEGPFVKRLEDNMAAYVGRKHAAAVSNGTVALDLAIEAMELNPGDEVIMPAFTIISCILGLVRRGIKPVLVDSDPDTWNMDVSHIEEKITAKTKAIMVVHIYGLPVDMDPVIELAHKYGLMIIEDGAEAHGLEYKGKKCGSFGDISIMSFYPNKHVTTGEGGMVLTDNERMYERCNSFRNLCHKPGFRFVHEELGYNYRMSNIQAAVGVAQLEKIEEHLQKKQEMGKLYQEIFRNNEKFQKPLEKTSYAQNVYWVFGLVMDKSDKRSAHEVIEQLAKEGIGCRPFFYPMNLQPALKKLGLFEGESYPVAEWLYEKGFYVPSGLSLTEEQMLYIGEKVNAL
jgi:perosamine synthetase